MPQLPEIYAQDLRRGRVSIKDAAVENCAKEADYMNLVDSIAQMSMDMSAVKLQQNLQTTMLKKAMDTETQLAGNLIEMMDSVPHFSGENGSLLDVRA